MTEATPQTAAPGDDDSLVFEPADSSSHVEWEYAPTPLVPLGITEPQVLLATLQPHGANYVLAGIKHPVRRKEPSLIKAQDGTAIEVFGAPDKASNG